TWTRPGLSRHTRSLITISMLIAMNHRDELQMHLKAARNNGVTRDEIKEVLIHSAIYCGIPAANGAFHLAMEVWDQIGVESLEQDATEPVVPSSGRPSAALLMTTSSNGAESPLC